MIVLKILILFSPLLLLVEAKFKIGPFHRSPPAWIPEHTVSTDAAVNQRDLKSSQPTSWQHVHTDANRHTDNDHYHSALITSSPRVPLTLSTNPSVEEQTLPSVQVRPITPDATEKFVSVEPASVPSKITTHSPVEIQTSKPASANLSYSKYTDNGHQVNSLYHVPKPSSNHWSPPTLPKLPSQELSKLRDSQPMTVRPASIIYQTAPPITSVPTEKSVPTESTTSLPITSTDAVVEIQTPKLPQTNNLLPVYADNRLHDIRPSYINKPASSPWSPPQFVSFPSEALSVQRASQPNNVRPVSNAYQTPPPITSESTEKSVPTESTTLPPTTSTDSAVEIQTPKPPQSNKLFPVSADNRPHDTRPSYINKPATSPWSPPKFASLPSDALSVQRASPPNNLRPVSYAYQTPAPVTPLSTEKSVPTKSTTSLPITSTDAVLEIQTPKLPQSNKLIPVYADNRPHDTRPSYKPASSPWSPPKFASLPSEALSVQRASQPNNLRPVSYAYQTTAPVTPLSTEKSVPTESTTSLPITSTDAVVEIQTLKLPQTNNLLPVYADNRLHDIRPSYINKPASSPWSPPKFVSFPSEALSVQRASQPNNIRPISNAYQTPPPITSESTEKSVPMESTTLPPTTSTDSAVEIQTPKPPQSNKLFPVSADNRPHDTRPSYINKPETSPWSPPKFASLPSDALSVQRASQPNNLRPVSYAYQTPAPVIPLSTEKSVPTESTTSLPITSTDAVLEIQTPKLPQSNKLIPVYADNRPHDTRPSYKPASSPWSPPKFASLPSEALSVRRENNVRPVSYAYQTTATEKSVPTESTTSLPITSTDAVVEIQTPKLPQSNKLFPVYEDNKSQDTRPSYINKPASSTWSPPKFDTLPSVRLSMQRPIQPVNVYPARHSYQAPAAVTPVPKEISTPTESTTFLPETSTDSELEIQTPKPLQPNTPHLLHTDDGHQDTNDYHVAKPTSNTWYPPSILRASQPRPKPGYMRATYGYLYQISTLNNPVSTEISSAQNVPAVLTNNRNKFSIDPSVEIQTPEPSLIDSLQPVNTDDKRIESNFHYIPRTASSPWMPPKSTNSSSPADILRKHKETGPYHRPQRSANLWDPQTLDSFVEDRIPESDTLQPIETTDRPERKLLQFVCPQPYGYFKFNEQCGEYIECKNSIPLAYACPEGLHFNPLAQWTEYPCDYPSNVKCEYEKTPRPDTEPTSIPPPPPTTGSPSPNPTTGLPPPPPTTGLPPPPPPTTAPPAVIAPGPKNAPDYNICPQPNGYFKFSDKCSEYIECKNYVPLMFTCPAGLYFNPLAEWTEYPCDLPSKVQCDGEPHRANVIREIPKIPSTTQPPIVSTTISPEVTTPHHGSKLLDFECPQANGYFKHNDQCSEYIECKNYIPLLYTCPGGLHFDVNADWTQYPCADPAYVQCNKEPDTKQPTENPNKSLRPDVETQRPTVETPQSTVVTPGPNVVTPRPSMLPPQPTVVPRQPTSVTPYIPHFSTQGTLRPTTERPSHELIDFYCPKPNSYYSVASQCDSYVECKSNIAVQHYCPAGLYFNPKAQWPNPPCDYPSKVQCNTGHFIDPNIPSRPIWKTPRPIVVTRRSNFVTPRPTIVTHRPNVVTPRPTILTPRPTIVTPRPTIVTHKPIALIPRSTIATSRPLVVIPDETRLPRQPTPTESPSPSKRYFNDSCPESDGFYSVASQCDVYVECKNNTAIEQTCPDGLHFNPNAKYPDYPCGYPSEVKCSTGDVVQPADPTSECPHRDGFFPTNSGDCGEYTVCHAGVAIIKHCPAGLVFNFETDTCDWPINVPKCNQPKALEGFVCPAQPADKEGLIHKYRHRRSCKSFVACQKGQPRLLSCDDGLSFDEKTESCVDSALVLDCEAELPS